jgi:hypothetical protein
MSPSRVSSAGNEPTAGSAADLSGSPLGDLSQVPQFGKSVKSILSTRQERTQVCCSGTRCVCNPHGDRITTDVKAAERSVSIVPCARVGDAVTMPCAAAIHIMSSWPPHGITAKPSASDRFRLDQIHDSTRDAGGSPADRSLYTFATMLANKCCKPGEALVTRGRPSVTRTPRGDVVINVEVTVRFRIEFIDFPTDEKCSMEWWEASSAIPPSGYDPPARAGVWNPSHLHEKHGRTQVAAQSADQDMRLREAKADLLLPERKFITGTDTTWHGRALKSGTELDIFVSVSSACGASFVYLRYVYLEEDVEVVRSLSRKEDRSDETICPTDQRRSSVDALRDAGSTARAA